jgi:hypothetical protein
VGSALGSSPLHVRSTDSRLLRQSLQSQAYPHWGWREQWGAGQLYWGLGLGLGSCCYLVVSFCPHSLMAFPPPCGFCSRASAPFFFFFWDRVLLCSPGQPWTSNSSASTTPVLELLVWATTPGLSALLKWQLKIGKWLHCLLWGATRSTQRGCLTPAS